MPCDGVKKRAKLSDKLSDVLFVTIIFLIPTEALRLFRDKLTKFERKEIKNFPQIFYLGLDAQKIKAVEGAPQNHGFDDTNGVYIKVSCSLSCVDIEI